MQESGFRMRWSVECRNCRAKGRGCVYKSADTDFLFKCEAEYDYYADLVYIYTVLAAMSLAALIGFIRFILLPLVIFAFLLHKYLSTRNKIDYGREEPSQIQQPFSPERFNYTDILSMANNFKDKLGQGCFGTVYKGRLPSDHAIVVKKLESIKVGEDHFINVVSIIGQIQHPNFVPNLGFCSEGSKHVLVNQYMPNGSLDKYIFTDGGNPGLFSWEKIWEIVVETGRGIELLHGRSDGGIAHLNIKPQNILLDENLRPRISDFGLSILYPKKQDFMPFYGRSETMGYMAPELMISRDFKAMSCKSDVYSFGMIMLEMACRRRHVDVDAINSSKVHFPTWVYELNERGDLEFENLTESDAVIARKLFVIGLWCTQTPPSDRPSMTRVLEMLQRNLHDLEMPPKPVLAEYLRETEPESDSPKEMLLPETVERSS
ncbi:rust resistance kinase Lr10-like [Hibiscus syriacus]|uniref:rust resistance kinase Lr10-like n=1 Tax=Hibiscus syriacus TaxID=106335 RepID=UPI001921102D|nr:rust resistance kinase Lr10-like [Hibiscus syriacus]